MFRIPSTLPSTPSVATARPSVPTFLPSYAPRSSTRAASDTHRHQRPMREPVDRRRLWPQPSPVAELALRLCRQVVAR